MTVSASHQIEAFAWWLDQDRKGRTAESIAERFGITTRQADTWRAAFDRKLSQTLQASVASKLKTYVAEYEQIQSSAIEQAQTLVAITKREVEKLRQASEDFGKVDLKAVGAVASSLKTVYSLAESASGADVAKRRASQKPASGGKGDGKLALPDLGAFFLAESVEVETLGDVIASGENGSINESGNESGSASAEMPEK